MIYSSEIESDRRKLENLITIELQNKIKQEDLVDTGSLLDSIKAEVTFTQDGLNVDIIAEDYYKYLDEEYNLTESIIDSKIVSDFMEEIFGQIIIEMMVLN